VTKRKDSKASREVQSGPVSAKSAAAKQLSDRIMALGAIVYGIAVAILSENPRPTTWGLDAPGYLPPFLRLVILAVVAVGIVLILTVVFGRAGDPSGHSVHQPRERRNHLPAWVLPVSLIALVLSLWLLRVRSFFLGDQMVWLQNLRAGLFPLYSEPLAAVVWRGYVVLLRALGVPVGEQSLIFLPILCGCAATVLTWKISRYIAADRIARLTGFALIATLGTAQLFCGYVESYPIVSVAVLLYILAAIRFEHGEGGAALVGIALALAVATHLIGLIFIPSYIVLVLRSPMHSLRRVILLLVPILAGIGVGWILAIDPGELMRPFQILRVAVESSTRGAAQPTPLAILIARPLAELGNLILLVLPVPALLIASHVLARAWQGQIPRRDFSFLMWAAVPGIVAAAVLVLPGSPAQDWDLLSVAVLPAAVLGVFLGLASAPRPGARRLALGLTALAAGPLLAFALVNGDESAGTRRFKTIIDPSTRMSAHERAYANEKLVKYYMARKDFDSVFVYAQRAKAAEPGNTRYWGNIGTALYNLPRYDEATRYFEEALRRGSDRVEAHYNLGLCYMRTQRYSEALHEFQIAIELGGEQPKYLNNLGMALLATGDSEKARATWLYVRKQWPDFEPTARALDTYFGRTVKEH
jgi:tetratricopeptide (TPR) repeat protein